MKKIYSILTFMMLLSIGAFAQAPGFFNYQGVARNSVGNVLVNKNITLRLTIHDLTATGATVYQETRTTLTNPFGLFNVQIGSAGATNITGTITGTAWYNGAKYIQVEIDPADGAGMRNVGTVQLAAVPYAIHSNTSSELILPFIKSQSVTGSALFGLTNSATGGTQGAIQGTSASNDNNAVAIQGTISSTSAGIFSAALRGINNSTTNAGIGVWGSHAGSGWGVYGTTASGTGVYGQTTGTGGTAIVANGTSSASSYALQTAGRVQITGQGAALNRILVSDAGGNATWQDASAIGAVTGTGTLNFLPKWTPNGTTIGNSMLFDNGTNIGLNTTAPTAKFHIATNSLVNNPQLMIDETDDDFARINFKSTSASNSGNNYWAIATYNNDTRANERLNFYNAAKGNLMSLAGDGRFSVGMTNPSNTMITSMAPLNSGLLSGTQYMNDGTGTAGTDGFYVGQFSQNLANEALILNRENTDILVATNSTIRQRIKKSGEVVIGGDATGAKLTVIGQGSTDLTLGNGDIVRTAANFRNDVTTAAANTGLVVSALNSSTVNTGVTVDMVQNASVTATSYNGINIMGDNFNTTSAIVGTKTTLTNSGAGTLNGHTTSVSGLSTGTSIGQNTFVSSINGAAYGALNTILASGSGDAAANSTAVIAAGTGSATGPIYTIVSGTSGVATGMVTSILGGASATGADFIVSGLNGSAIVSGIDLTVSNSNPALANGAANGINVTMATVPSTTVVNNADGVALPAGWFKSSGGQGIVANAMGTYTSNTWGSPLAQGTLSIATSPGAVQQQGLAAYAANGSQYNYGAFAFITGPAGSIHNAAVGGADYINAVNSYAGYFQGKMTATGTKLFTIDHPLDPANKILHHAAIESNEVLNMYSGNITTDANGYATVSLPDYFEALNKDFRYQLTVIGSFAQAIVKNKVANNKFVIQTNQPNTEVSWEVKGVRNDAWMKANPMVVEETKSADAKGKYIYPQGFGKGMESSMNGVKGDVITTETAPLRVMTRDDIKLPAIPVINKGDGINKSTDLHPTQGNELLIMKTTTSETSNKN